MKVAAESSVRAVNPRMTRAAAHSARPQPAGPLACMMLFYIVIVVGRVADVVPLLSGLQLAKIVIVLSVLIAFQKRDAMAPTQVWSLVPAKLTLEIMLLMTVSILFSVLRSGTLGVITGTVLSVSVGLVLIIKSAKTWQATRVLLFGCVISAIVLAAAARVTSFAGRAGEISSLDPNDFAFVLDGLLPIAVAFALISPGIKKLCYIAASMFVIVSILLTQSRGGLLGLIAGILLMTLILPTKRHGSLAPHVSAGTVAVRFLLLILVTTFVWNSLPDSTRTRLATVTTVDSDSMSTASDGRFTIWTDTLPLSLRRPWGWGAGAFTTVDGKFAGGRYKAPHNMFLEALIELGFLGLGLLLATIASSISFLIRESWAPAKTNDRDSLERRAFARALIASLIALCVSGFFLSELYSQTFWIIIVLTCVVGRSKIESSVSGAKAIDGSSHIRRV